MNYSLFSQPSRVVNRADVLCLYLARNNQFCIFLCNTMVAVVVIWYVPRMKRELYNEPSLDLT